MKEHIPGEFKEGTLKEEQVVYVIGTEHRPGEFGVWHGPNPDEKEMLEVFGGSRKDCIIRFNLDGTSDVIWRWSGSRWISMKE